MGEQETLVVGLRYLPNVVTLTLDQQKCTGCGTCTSVCPHAVFALENSAVENNNDKKNKKQVRIVDRDACMECGACARNCPAEALAVESGVGCAAAIIIGALRGTAPDCGCSGEPSCCE